MTFIVACDMCHKPIDSSVSGGYFYSAKVNNGCLTMEYFEYTRAKEVPNHICSKVCLANFVRLLSDEMVKELQINLKEKDK